MDYFIERTAGPGSYFDENDLITLLNKELQSGEATSDTINELLVHLRLSLNNYIPANADQYFQKLLSQNEPIQDLPALQNIINQVNNEVNPPIE